MLIGAPNTSTSPNSAAPQDFEELPTFPQGSLTWTQQPLAEPEVFLRHDDSSIISRALVVLPTIPVPPSAVNHHVDRWFSFRHNLHLKQRRAWY